MGQLPDISALIPEEEATVNRQQEAGCCTEWNPTSPPPWGLRHHPTWKFQKEYKRIGIKKKAFILVTTSSADQNNINHLYNGIIDFE
jgi:hypothetical protein